MANFIRDTALGFIIRLVTRNHVLQFPEDRPDFQCPTAYQHTPEQQTISPSGPTLELTAPNSEEVVDGVESRGQRIPIREINDAEKRPTLDTLDTEPDTEESSINDVVLPTRVDTHLDMARVRTTNDLEKAFSNATLAKGPSRPIVPTRTVDGITLVDWYTTDDPENPQNWSAAKKGFVAFQICLYTFGVYMGSAIYTASEPGVIEVFGVSITEASLGLGLYVLGYGIGPLLFSPLSEIPIIGRNPPYIITFGIFVILCIPTALVDNFAGLLVLRFLQGFFGSPCLATGGATFGDLYDILQLPFLMVFWVAAATFGPSFGPLISGFSVVYGGWRWSLWEMLWLSGPTFVLLFLCLPETSSNNILLRRAARLRKVTGNPKFQSQSEIDQAKLTAKEVLVEALYRPFQIEILDPSVAFVTIYSSLTYGIYYSFFEAFPLVYMDRYGFNLGQMGLAFLSITSGLSIAIPMYFAYLYFVVNPNIRAHGLGAPEQRLVPALISSFLVPIGLFIFAWTSDGQIHWLVCTMGILIFTMGIFIVFQCVFLYVPLSYPQYAASLFAGNDFARSTLSLASILFARPLFLNLGVARGVSLLAGLTVGCVGGIYALWYWGANLRARSRFTVK